MTDASTIHLPRGLRPNQFTCCAINEEGAKIPYSPRLRGAPFRKPRHVYRARSNDPKTWGALDEVLERIDGGVHGYRYEWSEGRYVFDAPVLPAVNYVITPGQFLLDVDEVIEDPQNPPGYMAELLERFNTYSEFSLNGKLHIVGDYGDPDSFFRELGFGSRPRKASGFWSFEDHLIELYLGEPAHFVTMTGRPIPHHHNLELEIRDCRSELLEFLRERAAPAKRLRARSSLTTGSTSPTTSDRDPLPTYAGGPVPAGVRHDVLVTEAWRLAREGLDTEQIVEELRRLVSENFQGGDRPEEELRAAAASAVEKQQEQRATRLRRAYLRGGAAPIEDLEPQWEHFSPLSRAVSFLARQASELSLDPEWPAEDTESLGGFYRDVLRDLAAEIRIGMGFPARARCVDPHYLLLEERNPAGGDAIKKGLVGRRCRKPDCPRCFPYRLAIEALALLAALRMEELDERVEPGGPVFLLELPEDDWTWHRLSCRLRKLRSQYAVVRDGEHRLVLTTKREAGDDSATEIAPDARRHAILSLVQRTVQQKHRSLVSLSTRWRAVRRILEEWIRYEGDMTSVALSRGQSGRSLMKRLKIHAPASVEFRGDLDDTDLASSVFWSDPIRASHYVKPLGMSTYGDVTKGSSPIVTSPYVERGGGVTNGAATGPPR